MAKNRFFSQCAILHIYGLINNVISTARLKIEPDNIENILFDLGGVLLNIDYSVTERAFMYLGIEKFNEVYSQSRQDGLFDNYEKGLISEEEFVHNIQDYFRDEKPTPEAILQAWNSMLLDFPLERLEGLKLLNENYRLFLLSNTNETHYQHFQEIITPLPEDFSAFFEKEYYSHQLGMRKPDNEVFELVLEENNILPERTLYIDDTKQHIKAAKKLNFQTLHLKKGQEVIVALHDLSVLA